MHYRGLTAFLSLSGFIIMIVTGVILFVEPEGRIAYWTDWSLFGLTKPQWGNIHIMASFLWVIAGFFHLFFNWKVLTAYFYKKTKGGWNLKKELVLAVIITVFVIAGSIVPFAPFKQFADLGDNIKDSWVTSPEYEPPFGHAELLSLKTFCKKLNMPLDKAMATLREKGMTVEDPSLAVATIAKNNNMSPMNLYMLVKHLEVVVEIPKGSAITAEMVEEQFTGKGLGKKNFVKFVEENKLNAEEIRARLKTKNIELDENANFRDEADRLGVTPLDIVKAMLADDYRLQQS